MTYETFQQEVLTELQRKHFTGITPKLTQRTKRNGQIRHGILFDNSRTNASPVIYLEEYYAHYQMTGNFAEIIDILTNLYSRLPVMQVDKQKLSDFSLAKDNITMKLINTEKNLAFLETVPHIPFHDLSIVFYQILKIEHGRIIDMAINNESLKKWHMDVETLHEYALSNYTRLSPVKFTSVKQQFLDMGVPLQELTPESYGKPDERIIEDLDNSLYLLSNDRMTDGAILITCKNLMDAIGDFFGENYYVIPSSVHEVLLLPESKVPSKASLDIMIQEVNQTQVEPEDYLSDHAYYFSRSETSTIPFLFQNTVSPAISSIF